MDPLPPDPPSETADLLSALAEMRAIKRQTAQTLQASRVLLGRVESLCDQGVERTSSIPRRRLPWVAPKGIERDRVFLVSEGDEELEERLAAEIERRFGEGWSLEGIAYASDETQFVKAVVDFKRLAPESASD